MENNQQQILSEIKTLMASVRNKLEELDAKIALWQQLADPQEADAPIDLDFDIDMVEGLPAMVSVADNLVPEESAQEESDTADEPVENEPVVGDDPVVEEPIVEELVVEELVVEEPVVEEPVVDEPVIEEAPAEDLVVAEPVLEEQVAEEPVLEDDLPFFDIPEEAKSESVAPAVQQVDAKPAVIDLMTEKHAWRTAMPGSPVKDVRGAIALMDRVLFINNLFGTDAMAFQETLNQINQMQTLDEAVEYLAGTHPEWDFNSQIVYSFMMAVRRKVN